MKTLMASLVILFCWNCFAQVRLGLNDLTHLLPLPKIDEVAYSLSPKMSGPRGDLIPFYIYQRLPRLVPSLDPANLYQQSWKVIAIRLDPCFRETMVTRNCQPQIRLVWQPLFAKEYSIATIDASMHTFYNLQPTEWNAFMQAYRQLKASTPFRDSTALQVSPALIASGYKSLYWQQFSKLLLSYIGSQNLIRLTFMNVNQTGNIWVFAGYKISNSQMELLSIPGIEKKSQAVTAQRLGSAETIVNVIPRPQGHDLYFNFLQDSSTAKKTWTPDQIQSAFKSSTEFDNPSRHNSGTISCASCHASRSLNIIVKNSFVNWDFRQIQKGIAYESNSNLTNTTISFMRGDSMRLLGYFDRVPVISDRVINDTDVSLRQIQQ